MVLYLVRNRVNYFLLKTSIIEHFQQGDKKEKRLGIQFITHKVTEEMGKSNQLHVLRLSKQWLWKMKGQLFMGLEGPPIV